MDVSSYRTRFDRATLPRHNSLSSAGAKLAVRHSPAAGSQLGSVSSEAKTAAAQTNGAKGGRPVGS